MRLRFVINPELKAEVVAELRRAAGWEGREEKLNKVLGRTYMTAACFAGKDLIGFVDVISDCVDDAFIRNLIVHPDFQRQGIALELLKKVIGKIREDRIKTVNVLFEPELTGLYQKAGFTIISGGIIDHEAEEF